MPQAMMMSKIYNTGEYGRHNLAPKTINIMEEIKLNHDIRVLCVKAPSFPEGIQEAFDRLHALIPFTTNQNFFGISRPEPSENGAIVYRAGIEEKEEDQAKRLGTEVILLRKGKYITQKVTDYQDDPTLIARAFEELLQYPDLDPDGYCVEWYTQGEKSVKCMVRLHS